MEYNYKRVFSKYRTDCLNSKIKKREVSLLHISAKILDTIYYLVNEYLSYDFVEKTLNSFINDESIRTNILCNFENALEHLEQGRVEQAQEFLTNLDCYIFDNYASYMREEILSSKLARKRGLTMQSNTIDFVKYYYDNPTKDIMNNALPKVGDNLTSHFFLIDNDDKHILFTHYYLRYFVNEKFAELRDHEDWITSILIYRDVSEELEHLSFKYYGKGYKDVVNFNDYETCKEFIKRTGAKYLINPQRLYNDIKQDFKSNKLTFEQLKSDIELFNSYENMETENLTFKFRLVNPLYVAKSKPYKYETRFVSRFFRVIEKIDTYIQAGRLFGSSYKEYLEYFLKDYFHGQTINEHYKFTNNFLNFLSSLLIEYSKERDNIVIYNFNVAPIERFIKLKNNKDNSISLFRIEDTKKRSQMAAFNTYLYDSLLNDVTYHNIDEFEFNNLITKQNLLLLNLVLSKFEKDFSFIQRFAHILNDNSVLMLITSTDYIDTIEKAEQFDLLLKENNLTLETMISLRKAYKFERNYYPYVQDVLYIFRKNGNKKNFSFVNMTRFVDHEEQIKKEYPNISREDLEKELTKCCTFEKEYNSKYLICKNNIPRLDFKDEW